MAGQRADIDIVVYDGLAGMSTPLIRALAQSFVVCSRGLEAPEPPDGVKAPLSIFFTSLSSLGAFHRAKARAERLEGEKLFVLPTHSSDNARRLRELGATGYLVMPVDPVDLCETARAALNRRVEASWRLLDLPERRSLEASVDCFKDCFAKIRSGEPLPVRRIEESCRLICEATSSGSLTNWLAALRDHHDFTLRHSLLVCGCLTYFASSIGIGSHDLRALSVGGMIHDIGKMRIPLNILNKPGKLGEEEWAIMRRHPDYAREILLHEHQLGPEAVAIALQHHERLDGTGYPCGLRGAEIGDPVRLVAISDVFIALIERRSYKGQMSSEAALDLMGAAAGQLDPDLLRAFRGFVLDQGQAALSMPLAASAG